VLLAVAVLAVVASALAGTSLSEESITALLSAFTSLVLLVVGALLWRRLPDHERRLTVAPKGSWRSIVATGVAVVVAAGAVIAAGAALDPVAERRLEEMDPIGTDPWQVVAMLVALIVLAPLGEELLFRGLMLGALARGLALTSAAAISAALFTAAHADACVIWPRALSVFITAIALVWVYRRRGYPTAVIAHAVVNTVAGVSLLAPA
jgi:membrane protease YdiL (CAAX protease family)